MIFSAGRLYKHRSMIDCCFRVVKRQYADAQRIKLRVTWYLYRNFMPMGFTETVEIQRADLNNWSEIVE